MKGVELLASLIAILMMIGISALLGGAIIFVLNAVRQPLSDRIDYELYLSSIYPPVKFETMLLSYLESTEENSGFQIKKILTYAAYQKNITNVFVEGNNEVTMLSESTYGIFSVWLGGNGYIITLNVGDDQYIIAENTRAFPTLPDKALKLKRISVPLYTDAALIRRSIAEKGRELPLNVTLDFYVL